MRKRNGARVEVRVTAQAFVVLGVVFSAACAGEEPETRDDDAADSWGGDTDVVDAPDVDGDAPAEVDGGEASDDIGSDVDSIDSDDEDVPDAAADSWSDTDSPREDQACWRESDWDFGFELPADVCAWEGDIDLADESSIARFTMSGCAAVCGRVTLVSSELTEIPDAGIRFVAGVVLIADNPQLVSLGGLADLEAATAVSIGGQVDPRTAPMVLAGNAQLESLDGLTNFRLGSLTVAANDNLVELAPPPAFERTPDGGSLTVLENPRLSALTEDWPAAATHLGFCQIQNNQCLLEADVFSFFAASGCIPGESILVPNGSMAPCGD